MKVSTVLIFVLQWNMYFASEEYVITRRWQDKFKFPLSECDANWEKKCLVYDGRKTNNNCICACNQNKNYTFGFLDGKWSCRLSSEIRTSGCQDRIAIFDGEDDNVPLKSMSIAQSDSHVGYVYVEASSCNLEEMFSYMTCSGTWKTSNQDASIGFQITFVNYYIEVYKKGKSQFDNYRPKLQGKILKLSVLCKADERPSTQWRLCIFLKVNGQQTCSVPVPTTISVPTTTVSTTTIKEISSTIISTTTSSPTQYTTSSTARPSTTPSTSTAPKTQIASSTTTTVKPSQKQSSTKPETPTTTKAPLKSGGDSGSSKADNSAIIAGPIGGVAALITIIIIVLFVRVRMKRNKRDANSRDAQNAVYDGVVMNNSSRPRDQSPPGDDEYAYAYTNTHPTVIKDRNGAALPVPHVLNGNASSPIYNTLGDPDFAKLNTANETSYNVLDRNPEAGWKTPSSSEAPVYNTLEDQSYAKINKTRKKQQRDPSYNVLQREPHRNQNSTTSGGPACDTLQEPSYAKVNKPNKKQQREPSYNVLERGPAAQWNKQNEPFYDALEKPKPALKVAKTSEAPIYNTLEDPNYAAPETTGDSKNERKDKATRENPIYNVLEGPNSTHDSPIYNVLEGPNSTHDSPIYNVLEDPTESSPVYDELEQPGSEENHVYGALQNYDPHVYGALSSPTSTNTNFDYNDEYSYVGDVICHDDVRAVDSDVYQQLNRDRQSSMEEQYEPLRHSKMFIDMQDMNGEEQSHA